MGDLLQEVQNEVSRIKEEIAFTKSSFPNGNVNFILYEMTLSEAERAVREHDTVTLIKILPELQGM